ncbi:hypothetical protein B0H63DRAFT_547063 [Podospora didyma]|uniref:Swt1-like HEPN domain-containing protein n=1 Tax=Podospora didyma TaxID=330526 RepID=A0AAE0NBG7_9PEZI|nr:hypothetical protein B0H63DRAFT_547063 [Podospora didyma]
MSGSTNQIAESSTTNVNTRPLARPRSQLGPATSWASASRSAVGRTPVPSSPSGGLSARTRALVPASTPAPAPAPAHAPAEPTRPRPAYLTADWDSPLTSNGDHGVSKEQRNQNVPRYQRDTASSLRRTNLDGARRALDERSARAGRRTQTPFPPAANAGEHGRDSGVWGVVAAERVDAQGYDSVSDQSEEIHPNRADATAGAFQQEDEPSEETVVWHTEVPPQAAAESIPELELPGPLVATTRLNDTAWFAVGSETRIPSAIACINGEFGMNLLARGLRLAQESFYHAAYARWPGLWRSTFPDGPSMIRCGTSEMRDNLAWFNRDEGEAFRDDHFENVIRPALLRLNNIRNRIAHPGAMPDVAHYDTLLRDAQIAAIALDNEERALKVRTLRDELRAEAERVYAEVEQMAKAGSDGQRPEWKSHHERMFDKVVDMRPDQVPDWLRVVAEAWMPDDRKLI